MFLWFLLVEWLLLSVSNVGRRSFLCPRIPVSVRLSSLQMIQEKSASVYMTKQLHYLLFFYTLGLFLLILETGKWYY
jgi:hypothetical protein